jgi:hypothetical protein
MTDVKLVAFSFLLSFLLFNCSASAIGTVAGTNIVVGRAAVYHDFRVDYSNELSLFVAQGYGLNLATPEGTRPVPPGGSCYFPYTLTNVGNGSDIYSLRLSDTTSRWSSTLVKDENYNGIRDPSENTPAESEVILAEDASYYFFVVLTAPSSATATKEESGATTFYVSGKVNDGTGYYGANGLFYGGPDNASSLNSARVTFADINPPTVSDLTLNDRRRFPKDIISARIKVKAKILDDVPKNVGRIEIWFNDSLKYSGTPEDWKGSYNEESGQFEVDLPELAPGEYTFKIVAFDKLNNQAQESIAQLKVPSPSEEVGMIGDPLTYPNPFSPLKGEKTNFAYVLSRDAEITIFIYNILGQALWKKTFRAGEEGGKAGYNEVGWAGISDFGDILGNGIYIYKFVYNNKVIGKGKLTVLDRK